VSTDDDPESETTTVTRKGQVTIPKAFRDEFGLEPGDEVVWRTGEEGIVVRKVDRTSARGMLVPEDTSAETRRAVADELERRVHDHRERIEEELLEQDHGE
jgi:AbrB family looped-hinge helix DNA binding protein